LNLTDNLIGILPDGREARLFTFSCDGGLKFSVTNYGATLTSVSMPDRNGKSEEITAGFPQFSDYLGPHPYFGSTIGRFANRIGGGRFAIENEEFRLKMNNPFCQLHGGEGGFHTRLWDYSTEVKADFARIRFKYLSPHLEEGYPGNLLAEVSFTAYDNNSIEVEFAASTDRPTHVNLTNHAYFNLSGFNEDISGHHLMLNADKYLELDENQLPTGRMIDCKGGVFDFSSSVKLSDNGIPKENELDYCFVVNEPGNSAQPSVVLYHEPSGRKLSIYSTQPGVQVYSSNFLDGSLQGHGNIRYQKHSAICFETQHFPDSPNQPSFPSTLLKPGEKYHHKTTYLFKTE